MADEYGIRLKVTADTADAQKELDKLLEAKSRRVQEAAAAATGGAAPGSSGGAAGASGRGDWEVQILRVGTEAKKAAKEAGRVQAQNFTREVKDANIGGLIGKAAAGFILHQAASTAFSFARTAGGDNSGVDTAEGVFMGAGAGALMGGKFGPWGAAIGAIVGGVSALAGQAAAERQQRQEVANGYRMQWNQSNESTLTGWGETAKAQLLDWQGSREGRLEWLEGNRLDTARALNAAQARMDAVAGMDKNSNEFVKAQQNLSRAMSAYHTAVNDEAQERMKTLYDPYTVGSFGDSMGAKGLSVGPQVDVASANDRVIEQQTRMVDLLQKLVDLSNQGNGLDNANFRAAQDVIMSLQ